MPLNIKVVIDLEFVDSPENIGKYNKVDNLQFIVPYDVYFEQSDGMLFGYYSYKSIDYQKLPLTYSDYSHFRSTLMSYCGYSDLEHIERLDKHNHRENTIDNLMSEDISGKETLKFAELINFSDYKGVFGNMTSTKLYSDFNSNRSEFISYVVNLFDVGYDDLMIESYDHIMGCFEIASKNNGIVLYN